ncbi:MAG: TIGR04282 family arsenosugar biosynthesis glycosyltransferase [Cytophagales bacterium]|nr:TIGR04282 family arsenosugar biosynthesis glycosyltransferase [Cytophagales bacterium]
MERLLLVFVKNPVRGRVKTRLARTIGDEKALWVYEKLLAHTRRAARGVVAQRWVCYADFVPAADAWLEGGFAPHRQAGETLGDRMHEAFRQGFAAGYRPILIIGSDCPAISPALLEEAFRQLESFPVVLGPAADGGYYLLGMNHLVESLFRDKPWSTPAVLAETVADLQRAHIPYALLPVLSDVDEAADLDHLPPSFWHD